MKVVRLVALFCLLFLRQAWCDDVVAEGHKILSATINEKIGPGTVYYLKYVLEKSKEGDNSAVLLKINTPGGFLKSTREILELIDSSKKPVITYVAPSGGRAASAGAFILLAGHYAFMDEGTNVGAASPVKSDGSDVGDTMKEKILNDTKALMRSVAQKRDRNIEVSERFVSKALSLTAKEAKEKNVINSVISKDFTLKDALREYTVELRREGLKLDDENLRLVNIDKRAIDHFLSFISKPEIAYMLTTFGTIGIYVELMAFGTFIPGILGIISLVLGLIAITALPINAGFVALLIFGVCLLIVELTISGFGVAGLLGMVSFFFGGFYLFDEPVEATYYNIVYGVSSGLFVLFIVILFALSKKDRSLDSLINQEGACLTDFIGNAGYVSLKGEKYKAFSLHQEDMKKGDRVKIVKIKDRSLYVGPADG